MQEYDEFLARLFTAEDEVNTQLETKQAALTRLPPNSGSATVESACSLEWNWSRLQTPTLSSKLFLLVLDVSGPMPAPPLTPAAAIANRVVGPPPSSPQRSSAQLPTVGSRSPMGAPPGMRMRLPVGVGGGRIIS